MQKPLKSFPLFKSIDQALTKVYEVRAASGVKTATYGIQTASSSVTDKVTTMDRVAEAAWVFAVVDATLSDIERAVVTCSYDGLGTGRDAAIEALAQAFTTIAPRSRDLARAVLTREFDFGETYAKPLPQIATETDVCLRTVVSAVSRARKSIADTRRDIERKLYDAFAPLGWIAIRQAA